MNSYKHNQIKNLKPVFSVGFSLFLAFCMLIPSTASAYFGDQETSNENLFNASSLGISLTINNQTTDSRTVEIEADLDENVEYRLINATTTGAFCSDLEVEITQAGSNVYSGSLNSFNNTATSSLTSGNSEEWNYDFSVSNTSASYFGDCSVVFNYEANQQGYSIGEAFFEVEEDSFVLYGSDFGASPSQGVVLNEVLPNPEGDDTQNGLQGEWVEVYNNGATSVDLTGWYIQDLAGNVVTFGPTTTLNSQTTIDVAGSGNEWVVLFMGGAILNNTTAETVYLYDNNGNLKDQYSYNAGTNDNDADSDSNHTGGGDNEGPSGSETPENEGKSDARIPDGIGIWIDPEPTAGEPNYVSEEMLEDLGYSESMIVEIMSRQEAARQAREAREAAVIDEPQSIISTEEKIEKPTTDPSPTEDPEPIEPAKPDDEEKKQIQDGNKVDDETDEEIPEKVEDEEGKVGEKENPETSEKLETEPEEDNDIVDSDKQEDESAVEKEVEKPKEPETDPVPEATLNNDEDNEIVE